LLVKKRYFPSRDTLGQNSRCSVFTAAPRFRAFVQLPSGSLKLT
jgi:hypothetical protein